MGYHKDTPAAIVYQASNQLHQHVQQLKNGKKGGNFYMWEEVCRTGLLQNVCIDQLLDAEVGSKNWKNAVRCALKGINACENYKFMLSLFINFSYLAYH